MASNANQNPPTTPKKSDNDLNRLMGDLSDSWDLQLPLPRPGDTPLSRSKEPPTKQRDCVHRMKPLFFKNALYGCLDEFEGEATVLYNGWVHKPKAERGVVPEATRRTTHRPVSDSERKELVDVLFRILDKSFRQLGLSTPSSIPQRSQRLRGRRPDDSPIPIQLPSSAHKRRSDDHFDEDSGAKRVRQPDLPSLSNALYRGSPNAMPPPDRGRRPQQEFNPTRSTNTSFASNKSNVSSIFSMPSHTFPQTVTQETVPDIDDDDVNDKTQPNTRASSPHLIANTQSSEYEGASSFDDHLKDSFDANGMIRGLEVPDTQVQNESSQNLIDFSPEPEERTGLDAVKEVLQDRLKNVFPVIPEILESLPFHVLYEITRVFLHAEVSMSELCVTLPPSQLEYDQLWRYLTELPALKDKPFPERSSKEVWTTALNGYKSGSRGVLFAGSLQYTNSGPADPLFRLKLEPMKFELTHRLARRFGIDRFFEIDMPQISGNKIPQALQDLGDEGQPLIVNWLVDTPHQICRRSWKPFHVKKKERKDRKGEPKSEEANKAYRIYLFATDGDRFHQVVNPLLGPRNSPSHSPMSVRKLLDLARPTRKNTERTFLKLFARTDLLVSKNTATVVLIRSADPKRSQILFEEDLEYNGEVMTDGAGQLSPRLAREITEKLRLSYTPSGFQARIGEAKGFWSVDVQDKSDKIWIKVYSQQRKWEPSMRESGDANDESHRTFEVLRYSAPLKSADLNLQFLPLLADRASNSLDMKNALSSLLVEGLERELSDLQTAMEDPKCFRKWLRDSSSGISERLKNGAVLYKAGLPVTTEERLNMMLDAGFDPKKLYFVKELAKVAFKGKCDVLKKKLNITVGKSTYAYMVPDFAQVLEPDEVYIDFSSFVDDSSGFSGVLLNGVDVLVARSPAHYVSDIQKVKAVFKVELMGLKDVIVFPTKGNPSLAAKLSGGDYDGDIAWVCWDESIVNNFVTADVPAVPDLVREGFIRQDSTKYKDLILGARNSTSLFLNESFKFNMQQDLLGICTAYKESVCYTQKSVNTRESLYLSTLLSSLVDRAKQGYTFTEDDFNKFKREIVNFPTKKPSYKNETIDTKSGHIIDKLMLLADKTTERLLSELYENIPDPSAWDEDLARYYDWAKEMMTAEVEKLRCKLEEEGVSRDMSLTHAKRQSQWHPLITELDNGIKTIKSEWGSHWGKFRSKNNEDDPGYMAVIDTFYNKFTAILPSSNTPLAQSLLPSFLPDQELSSWALLRASALFASYRNRHSQSRFVWFMAGKQLARLKADYSGGGYPHCITPSAYAMLKPDATYVKRAMRDVSGSGPTFDEDCSIVNAEQLEDLED